MSALVFRSSTPSQVRSVLSNFAAAPTPHRGWLYPASEHAFAAANTRRSGHCRDPRRRRPAQAKRIGRAAPLVKGWEAGGKRAAPARCCPLRGCQLRRTGIDVRVDSELTP